MLLQRTQCFQRERRWWGEEEISQRTHICICVARGHRQQRVKAGGGGCWWELGGGEQRGEMGDLCDSINNKKVEWDTPNFTRSTKTTNNLLKNGKRT